MNKDGRQPWFIKDFLDDDEKRLDGNNGDNDEDNDVDDDDDVADDDVDNDDI